MTEAYDWYEDRVPVLARFLLCVDAKCHSSRATTLSSCAQDGKARPVAPFPYEIIFVEDDERVVVLSVFHANEPETLAGTDVSTQWTSAMKKLVLTMVNANCRKDEVTRLTRLTS